MSKLCVRYNCYLQLSTWIIKNRQRGDTTGKRIAFIPEEQSGSRKWRQSVLTALNKVLVTDISRQIRQLLTINRNDAQACYDRIVLWIVSLALHRIGLSAEAEFSTTNTLQSATYDIATVFGIFIDKYFPTTPPHQGSGQGNGAQDLPSGWWSALFYWPLFETRALV